MYQVIAENSDFMVICKSEGVNFHGDDGLVAKLREKHQVLGVHRLDKETSGLMLFAKNKLTQTELSQLFSERKVSKHYLALSDKRPRKKQGTIKGDLLKGRGGNYYLNKKNLNPSITSFSSGYPEEHNLRLFCLKPLTGKTHQLRVVLKSLGSPILGDKRYGGQTSDRMYLHAFHLLFEFRGVKYEFKNYPTSGVKFELLSDNFLDEFLEKTIS